MKKEILCLMFFVANFSTKAFAFEPVSEQCREKVLFAASAQVGSQIDPLRINRLTTPDLKQTSEVKFIFSFGVENRAGIAWYSSAVLIDSNCSIVYLSNVTFGKPNN